MKNKIACLIAIILCGGLLMSCSEKAQNKIRYKSLFDVKYAYCEVRTNDVPGIDNMLSVNRRGFGTSSTTAMLMMENGENKISLQFAALNWFDRSISSAREKSVFNPQAYCNVRTVVINDKEVEEIGKVSVSLDKSGRPVAAQSDVTVKEVNGVEVVPGFIADFAYEPQFFPSGMKLYEFSRTVTVKGLPEWRWINATPYTDTPEQRQLLQNAYEELWQIFSKKDLRLLKSKTAVSLNAWAYASNSTVNEIFNDYDFTRAFAKPDFKMQPINWDAYDAVIMNNGRMVRLVNKSNPNFSPLTQLYDDDVYFYAPIFSLIDGRFVPVL